MNNNSHTGPGGRKIGILLVALVNLVIVSGCVYVVVRGALLAGNLGWTINGVLTVGLLAGEAFVMYQSVAFYINLVGSRKMPAAPRADLGEREELPAVAVLVPARHEPFDVLERTLTCVYNLHYPNKKVYFLDDSSDEHYVREAEQLAVTYGAEVFRRETRHGAKAGIINDCVKTLDQKYVVILDADQNPAPGFLEDLVSIMEADPALAFVQTPQYYTNTDASPIVRAANMQHCMFYEFMCEGKSAHGAMILCGTNVIIRREALLDVGGLDEKSVTEDFSSTVDMHVKGWKSLYSPQTSVFGSGPETLGPYLRQQFRWSRGNLGVLKKVVKNMILHPFGLRPAQLWEHLATGSYYLIGWAYFLLMLCPITYIFLDTPTFFMEPEVYFLTFIPYFLLSFSLFFVGMAERHYRFSNLFDGVLLGFTAFPVYMKAAIAAFLGLRSSFAVTQKKGTGDALPYAAVWFQVTFWAVHFAALVWGVNRLVFEREPSILMSLVWVGYHFMLLSAVFFFRTAGIREERPATQHA